MNKYIFSVLLSTLIMPLANAQVPYYYLMAQMPGPGGPQGGGGMMGGPGMMMRPGGGFPGMDGPHEFDPLDMVGGVEGLLEKIEATNPALNVWGGAEAMEQAFESFALSVFNSNLKAKAIVKLPEAAPFLAVAKKVLKIPATQFANMVKRAGEQIAVEDAREKIDDKMELARSSETKEELDAVFGEINGIISGLPKALKKHFSYVKSEQKMIAMDINRRAMEDEMSSQGTEMASKMMEQGKTMAKQRMEQEMARGNEMMNQMQQGGGGFMGGGQFTGGMGPMGGMGGPGGGFGMMGGPGGPMGMMGGSMGPGGGGFPDMRGMGGDHNGPQGMDMNRMMGMFPGGPGGQGGPGMSGFPEGPGPSGMGGAPAPTPAPVNATGGTGASIYRIYRDYLRARWQ